ncbi:MAG: S26 family signal peptidase [Myxococcota bacterium]|nr:S26 family signal peptidase [Myxococcota bacterium]
MSGESMTPTLNPGDWVWVDVHTRRAPAVNDLVMVRDPSDPSRLLVKRVRSRGSSTFAVGSDNPLSGRDSRHFGSLTMPQLYGYVVGHIDLLSLQRSRWIER